MSFSLVAQSGAKPIGGGIRGLPEARPPGRGSASGRTQVEGFWGPLSELITSLQDVSDTSLWPTSPL